MGKYTIENNTFILCEKQPNILGRIVLYFLTLVFFIISISSILVSLFYGLGLHIGNILAFGFFGYLTYLLLKMSLWNTRGREIIEIRNNLVKYTADYYLFKDNVSEFDISDILLTIEKENPSDNRGSLRIQNSLNKTIETATKFETEIAQDLIYTLKTHINSLKQESNS